MHKSNFPLFHEGILLQPPQQHPDAYQLTLQFRQFLNCVRKQLLHHLLFQLSNNIRLYLFYIRLLKNIFLRSARNKYRKIFYDLHKQFSSFLAKVFASPNFLQHCFLPKYFHHHLLTQVKFRRKV